MRRAKRSITLRAVFRRINALLKDTGEQLEKRPGSFDLSLVDQQTGARRTVTCSIEELARYIEAIDPWEYISGF